jgi:hypothetical protein
VEGRQGGFPLGRLTQNEQEPVILMLLRILVNGAPNSLGEMLRRGDLGEI